MDDIRKAVGEAVSEDVYKIVLSAPVPGAGPYRRVTINRLPSGYQAEQFTETQVFHENLPPDPETLHA